MILVTDGEWNEGRRVGAALPALRQAGAVVSVVVIGGPPSHEILKLASDTGRTICLLLKEKYKRFNDNDNGIPPLCKCLHLQAYK